MCQLNDSLLFDLQLKGIVQFQSVSSLSSTSDQYPFSLYGSISWSDIQVMRIQEIVTKDDMFRFQGNFPIERTKK